MIRNAAKKGIALGLSLLLLLSAAACDSGKKAAATPTPAPTATPTPEPTPSPTPEVTDYTKYNTYSSILNYLDDIDRFFEHYFALIADDSEFAVLQEGAFWSLTSDVTNLSISMSSIRRTDSRGFPIIESYKEFLSMVVNMADEAPSYPQADAAARELGPIMTTLLDSIFSINDKKALSTYEDGDDSVIRGIHEEIYGSLEGYYTAAYNFTVAMDELERDTREQSLEELKERDKMIAYYSSQVIYVVKDLDETLWIGADEGEGTEVVIAGEAYQVNLTETERYYTQFNEAYEQLLLMMDDKSQRKSASRYFADEGEETSSSFNNYYNNCGALKTSVDAVMEALHSGSDLAETLNELYTALSNVVEDYNDYLTSY